MKKQQKTETSQNTTELSPCLDKNMISANKNMKNEANFKDINLATTSYSERAYNVLRTKTQNGTKPNEANLKPIPNTIKPSFQTGNSAKSKTLLLRNKANFNSLKFTASPCTTVVYDDLQTKNKNGANPNKPNQSQFRGENFLQEPRTYQHNGKIPVKPRFSPLTFFYIGVTLSLIINLKTRIAEFFYLFYHLSENTPCNIYWNFA